MADKDLIPDVLADRYASAAMAAIWSPEGKVKAERRLWVAVLEAQHRILGMEPPALTTLAAVNLRIAAMGDRCREAVVGIARQ